MAKNQEARKRKHNSRNGSSGRGNGVDTAKMNGKAKPKTVDETPGWQKTLGALVIITGVIAAAFMTGVIRIDRNIDNDAEQNHTQEAHSNVADIKDSKSNKTTVLFTQTEHNNLTSETPESDLKTEHHRDKDKKSNSDTEIDYKKVINSESIAHAPIQRFTESYADVTKEVSDVEEKEDKLDFQAEAAFEAKRDILEERVDEEKQPVPAPGNLKTDDPAKSFTGKEATVTETDFPKGKMVTPKRTPRSTENTKESKSKPPGKADEGSLKHADVLRPPKPQETLQVEETAPDRLESKSGGEQDVPSLIEVGEAAERKIGKADSVRPSPPKEMKQPEKTRTESKDHQTKDTKKAKVSPRKVDGVHPPAPLEVRSSPRKDDSVKPPPPVEKDMKKQSSRKSDDVSPPLPQKGRERLEESPRKTSRVRPPPPVDDREGVKKYARKAVSVSPLPPQEERGKSKEPPRKTDGGRTPPPLETRQREEERIMGNSDQARDRKSDSPPPPPPPAQETTQPEAERAMGNSDQATDRKSDSPPPPPPPAQETTQPEAEMAIGNSDQARDRKSDSPPPPPPPAQEKTQPEAERAKGDSDRATNRKSDSSPPAQETTQPEAERAMGNSDQATDRKSDRPPPPPPPAQETTQPEAERAMGNSDQATDRKSDRPPPPPPPAQETTQPEADRAMGNSDQATDRKSDRPPPPPPPAQETTQPEADRAMGNSDQATDRKSDRPPPPPPPAQETTQPEAERAMGNSDQATDRKSDRPPPPPPPAQETTQPEAERAMRNSDQAKDLKSKSPPPPAQETTQPEADRAIKKEEHPVDRSDTSKVRENISIKAENKKPIQKSALETLLEETEGLIQKNKKDQALYKYEDIIKRFPNSAKALMAKAQLLDMLAEERRSNDLLDGAIQSYRQAADAPHCPRDIKRAALARMGDRLSFFGKSSRSIQVYLELVKEFPDDYEAKKSLAVQYLIAGKNKRAKHYFEEMVERNPTDGFALVHLGFILKSEENYLEAIPLLRAGIDTGDRETNEGKFFFHLGESFLRTGQIEESYKIYDEAVSRGHFRSRYQRSLYNVDSLRGRQFWTPREAGFAEAAKILESNWETIRDEAVALLSTDGFFRNEEEKLRETGDWKQFTLFAKGSKDQGNCRQAPRTCGIFDSIPQSKNCRRGQVKFSVMHPGTHVWPHCGPTNCRLRSHLGLIIPQPVRLRVGNSTRTWEEGKLFIFDDSFEHEVWQEADSLRLILIADLWHPDLTESEKRKLTPI
ncbi:serine/arginine repetitive matrix protein 1-like isoform X2 [Lytechinus variegatus]|uniref:serine/arginine repetitive matrix protein 1-like isoform X2 n=1 Tax=Lytechinus variegatus TaxID=7654 RepID=UPI001BB2333B|nr:serine/arginine repetitive matrix protein 1-like isoform X2 [Lytechinus variegatus]